MGDAWQQGRLSHSGRAQQGSKGTGRGKRFESQTNPARNQQKHGNAGVQQNNKAINRQVTLAAESGDINTLLTTIKTHLPDMNGINLATAFHRVAKLACTTQESRTTFVLKHPIFNALFDVIVKHIEQLDSQVSMRQHGRANEALVEMPAQYVSIVAWSCATLRIQNEQLFNTIARIAAHRLHHFKPFELSNLLWAYAKLGITSRDLFGAVVPHLLERQECQFKVQCLSTIAWAFATLRQRNVMLFNSIAKELCIYVDDLKSQEISNALWAFAKTRCASPPLFQAVARAACDSGKLPSFKVQELSNTVWAFATAGLMHQRLFSSIEALVIQRRCELEPQNIANILWAYTKLQASTNLGLFPMLLEVSVRSLHRHKPQELSAIVWAASPACPENSSFFGAAARCCLERLREFSPNALANLTKALSTVTMDTPEVFGEILRQGSDWLPTLEPLALCKFLRGAAAACLNPAFAAQKTEAVRAVTAACTSISDRIFLFQTFEMQEVSSVLRTYKCSLPLMSVEALEQVLHLRCKSGEPSCPQSLGSLSTSAEGSQHEDDFEDSYWPINGEDTEQGAKTVVEPDKPLTPKFVEWPEPSCNNNNLDADKDLLGSVQPNFLQLYSAFAPAAPMMLPEPHELNRAEIPMITKDSHDGIPWRVPVPLSLFSSLSPDALSDLCKLDAQSLQRQMISPAFNDPGQIMYPNPQSLAPKPPTLGLPCVDRCSFVQLLQDGSERALDSVPMAPSKVLGTGSHVIHMQQGVARIRVVLKYMAAEACAVTAELHRPHILHPLAYMDMTGASLSAGHVVVYPHCEHGDLPNWVASRRKQGRTVSPPEVARIVLGVMYAAEKLMEQDLEAVGIVQADEIFITEGEDALLRAPLPGRAGGWQDDLKWLSPDEASGRLNGKDSGWPALAFRLGLLLYCLGTDNCKDPYPAKTGEEVLVGLLNEANQAMRPDLAKYKGPDILRRLMSACLQVGCPVMPTKTTMVAMLEALATA